MTREWESLNPKAEVARMHRDGRSRCESCWRQAGKNDVHLLPEELDEKVANFSHSRRSSGLGSEVSSGLLLAFTTSNLLMLDQLCGVGALAHRGLTS